MAELVMFGIAACSATKVFSHNPGYLISLQAMKGVTAALYGVLLTLIVADLAKGTGRFNFLQGTTQSAMGIGGFLSNLLFRWIAKLAGFDISFLGLARVAVAGGLWYQLRMPETKAEGEKDKADG